MRFAREGIMYIGVAFAVAALVMAIALQRRSWPIWLVSAGLFVVALLIAYRFRDPLSWRPS